MEITAMNQLAGAVAPTPPVAIRALPPDDLVVDRFNEVMKAPATGAELAIQNGAVIPDGKPGSLGEAILRGLTGMSKDLSRTWSAVQGTATGQLRAQELSPAILLEAQGKVLEFTVLYEIVGKGISKSAQSLDQLVKMQ